MNNKRSTILKFWKNLIILLLILAGLQFLLSFLIEESLPAIRMIIGNIFLFVITGLSYSVFIILKEKYQHYSGYIFGSISILKMIIAVVFLLPVLLKENEKELFFVIEFLIYYMIYLLFETLTLLKQIKKHI